MKQIKKGFTLIELLVVIAIISILISVGAVSYLRAVRLSRDSKRQTDLEQIRQALETFRSQYSYYPTSDSLLVPDFITTLPTDPKTATSYTYQASGSYPTTYLICTTLESPEPTSYCVNQP